MNFIKTLALIFIFGFTYSNAIVLPDNNYDYGDRITVSMSNIDDIGIIMLKNKRGTNPILVSEWINGEHGSGSRDITNLLDVGDNYIVYAVYNKYYAGTGIFAGGKYSFYFSMSKNGASIFSASDFVRDNSKGIKYWKIIKLTLDKNGNIRASDNVSSSIISQIQNKLSNLERDLNSNYGISVPF